jgi:hypothetical protein
MKIEREIMVLIKKRILSTVGIALFVCLGGIILANLIPIPCRGSDMVSKAIVFSLDVKGKPLAKVLETISKATGYEITVNEELQKLPVTATLQNVTLREGLRRIIGPFNHVLLFNDAEKKIAIMIYAVGSRTSDIQAKLNLRQPPGDRPVGDKWAALPVEKEVEPRNIEVIPPEKPGGQGVTQAEVDEMLERQKQIDPQEIEVIPPETPGQRGVSQAEVDAGRRETNPKDIYVEAVPPDNLMEKAVAR